MDIGILGAGGYVGLELLRLLLGHPEVSVRRITSEQFAGKKVSELFPHLQPGCDLVFAPHQSDPGGEECEVWFGALPHRISMSFIPPLLSRGKTVIDLSADYRLSDPKVYRDWYGHEHTSPDLLPEAVYGLSEWNRERIRSARLVACPGCYPTAAVLGLAPAIERGILDPKTVVVHSLSGVSGAGRKAEIAYNFVELNENAYAYGVPNHRHTPEMEQELGRIGKNPIVVTFIPHLIPVSRGIYSTCTASLRRAMDVGEIREIYQKKYAGEPFVQVEPDSRFPQFRDVRGTNNCRIGIALDDRTGRLVVTSVLDNLVKGAAGQAVQNLNIRMGYPEETGLIHRWGF